MNDNAKTPDPYNLIITGVGGQGNVLASRMVGDMMSQLGYFVTIGETFGASQRGGSVMSHLRIAANDAWSPQIPLGTAHAHRGPGAHRSHPGSERLRQPEVQVVCNTRPVYPVGVIRGDLAYPAMEDIRRWVAELSQKAWFVNATDLALEMGSPILANVICVGALSATGALPFGREDFGEVVARKMPAREKIEMNLRAFELGFDMIRRSAKPGLSHPGRPCFKTRVLAAHWAAGRRSPFWP